MSTSFGNIMSGVNFDLQNNLPTDPSGNVSNSTLLAKLQQTFNDATAEQLKATDVTTQGNSALDIVKKQINS